MRLCTRFAAAGLLGFLFLQPLQAAGQLDPQALDALFPGTFQAVVHGYNVSFVARRDGSLHGKFQSDTDTGQWSIQKGELCIMLSNWLKGRTSCSRVVQQGDWYRAENVVFRKN
jgi:hypothetical protein